MSFETVLRDALVNSPSTVGDIVGTRIYPVEAEQNKEVPYVVYELISSVPVEHPGDVTQEINESVVDIACHAATYAGAKSLAAAVRSALINVLDASVIEDTQDQRDSDTRRKSVVQTYRIWHVEEFP